MRRAGRRLLSIALIALMCAGLAVSASHSHDGAVTPNACAVCHVSAEAHGDVPAAPTIVDTGSVVRLLPEPPAPAPLTRRPLPGIHGPRSPPA